MLVSDAVLCFKNVYVVYPPQEAWALASDQFFWELLSRPRMNIFHSLWLKKFIHSKLSYNYFVTHRNPLSFKYNFQQRQNEFTCSTENGLTEMWNSFPSFSAKANHKSCLCWKNILLYIVVNYRFCHNKTCFLLIVLYFWYSNKLICLLSYTYLINTPSAQYKILCFGRLTVTMEMVQMIVICYLRSML